MIKQDTSDSFSIGEVVKARDRLWRVDNIHLPEDDEKNVYYSVSSITGNPSSQVLLPSIEPVAKAVVPAPDVDVIGQPIYQRILLKAIKLDLIYGTSSFISLQNSKVIPISYQMVPVLMALNLQKVRLLLADDVGLGKTIEAGLILQELLGRKRINRVLFVTPANLREQWQAILRNFFGLEAVIMSRRNRRFLESELLVGGNPWGYYNFIITSIDYARRPEVRDELIQFKWDMVVIDEAHNVTRPHLGTDDESSKSFKKSYGFARKLSEKFEHLLLLSATPHNGYKDSFASLLEMVNDQIVHGSGDDIEIDRDLALSHVCQRRRQDVMKWMESTRLQRNPFPKRDSDEIYIQPSELFNQTIEELAKFSRHVRKRAESEKDRERKLNYWTILHFHKRAISSPNALICSVDHRLEEIDKRLNQKFLAIEETDSYLTVGEAAEAVFDGVETDRLTEEERDYRSDKLLLTQDLEDLSKEKALLIDVKKIATKLKKNDSKIAFLVDHLLPDRMKDSRKFIIFTRYIDTLEYIVRNLKERFEGSLKFKDFRVYYVHGKMPSQKRQDIYNTFLNEKEGILVSTDCMAEGIDLQYSANQLINYELTWNPNRLEQRNGRIDRFGQPAEKVYIRNLIMKDTLEMDILELLVAKAEEIKNEYGFIPGFFGDPKSIIDHIRINRKKIEKRKQSTLLDYITFSKEVKEDLVSVFFSKENVQNMVKDSFYGHNNINLDDIESRMRLTEESIGNAETLLEFLKDVIPLFKGKITVTNENADIYELTLPDGVKQDIHVEFDGGYLVTPNMEIASSRSNVEGITLKNDLISGLIEKVKNEAFSEMNDFYGRTAAIASPLVNEVVAILNIKIRYVVNTKQKTLMEEITTIGIDLINGRRIDQETIDKLWNSRWENHGKPIVLLKKQLKKIIELQNLEQVQIDVAKERLEFLIKERQDLRMKLEKQGVAADLEGIDDIEVVGRDLLTVTLVYPGSSE
ncbi:MAG: helicase-related protein [Promethearchaeota archaeon]